LDSFDIGKALMHASAHEQHEHIAQRLLQPQPQVHQASPSDRRDLRQRKLVGSPRARIAQTRHGCLAQGACATSLFHLDPGLAAKPGEARGAGLRPAQCRADVFPCRELFNVSSRTRAFQRLVPPGRFHGAAPYQDVGGELLPAGGLRNSERERVRPKRAVARVQPNRGGLRRRAWNLRCFRETGELLRFCLPVADSESQASILPSS